MFDVCKVFRSKVYECWICLIESGSRLIQPYYQRCVCIRILSFQRCKTILYFCRYSDMTFEEQMRIIELKELNSEDQRKVFTKLVCVYFENKSSGQNGNNNEFPEKMTSSCLTNGVNSNSNLLHSDYCYNEKEANLKGSFSASNLNSSIYSIHPGTGWNGLLKCFSRQNLFSMKSYALHFTAFHCNILCV